MRLVMKYDVGDGCTFSCQVVEPINHESVEAAKLDFGSKILEIEEKLEAYEKALNQWNNRYSSISNPEKKMEFFRERPESPSTTIHFGGKTFSYGSFFESSYDHKKEKTEMFFVEPTFLTVDQWFGQK